MVIRNRLGLWLQRSDLSLLALSKKAGVNYGTLNNFYHERFNVVNGEFLVKICVALGCKIEDMLYFEEKKEDASA